MTGADNRPRVHIWPHSKLYSGDTGRACAWSFSATGRREEADTAGQALDAALAALGRRGEVVVIVEPLP